MRIIDNNRSILLNRTELKIISSRMTDPNFATYMHQALGWHLNQYVISVRSIAKRPVYIVIRPTITAITSWLNEHDIDLCIYMSDLVQFDESKHRIQHKADYWKELLS